MAHRGRSQKLGFPLFSADSESKCCIIRRVRMEEAEKMEALGVWERRYDQYSGELIGFRMVASFIDDRKVMHSKPTPAAICASEMEVNAFTKFRDGRSRTARLSELDKLKRIHDGLPPEDHIERTYRKVLVFPYVGAAKGDILRAWPK